MARVLMPLTIAGISPKEAESLVSDFFKPLNEKGLEGLDLLVDPTDLSNATLVTTWNSLKAAQNFQEGEEVKVALSNERLNMAGENKILVSADGIDKLNCQE